MKKKVEYIGYYELSEFEEFKKDWGSFEIAEIPYLHKKRGKKEYWSDGNSPKKMKITIEEL